VSPVAVVAFGGNALVADRQHQSIREQYATVSRTAPHLADMIAGGWSLVVSHGNGPQVGFILRRGELAGDEVDPVPLDYAVADTEGAIGSMFVRALTNELVRRGLSRPVVAVVTHCAVDPGDPAFASPNKPVGSFLDEATARARAEQLGWAIVEDSGRGWRRVVPSPRPQRILESDTIARVLDGGAVVVAAGGGGIPVSVASDGTVEGVEAVIDKDLASSLLARHLGAELLLIPTGVSRVAIGFGTPSERWLDSITVAEACRHSDSGEFGAGSMQPKVDAVAEFVAATPGAIGAIGAPTEIAEILAGRSGTRILADSRESSPSLSSLVTSRSYPQRQEE
jgi:carbamate kinase